MCPSVGKAGTARGVAGGLGEHRTLISVCLKNWDRTEEGKGGWGHTFVSEYWKSLRRGGKGWGWGWGGGGGGIIV